MHKNARLRPRGRERIVRQVESGQTPEAAEGRRLPADDSQVVPNCCSKINLGLSWQCGWVGDFDTFISKIRGAMNGYAALRGSARHHSRSAL